MNTICLMRRYLGLAAATAFFLFSRTATADDLSRVFVYSQWETPARSWIRIVCDGERVAEVKRGFFFAVNDLLSRYEKHLVVGLSLTVQFLSDQIN